MIRPALLLLAVALTPLPALAHKIVMGVFPSGNQIEGEIGFSSGEAPAGQLIEIFDTSGNKLGETTTDADGFFLFTPTEPIGLLFRADMGAGHVSEVTMSAAVVSDILGKAPPGAGATITYSGNTAPVAPLPRAQPTERGTIAYAAPQVTVASLTDAELVAIAQVVRDETRPLRQEIAAYKERNDFQTILGGIGYIVGLFGVGFYLAARRKLKEAE